MTKNTKKSFFQTLFERLLTTPDSLEYNRKKSLKTITKNYKKTKFNKYYNTRINELDVSIAKQFYFIYKTLGPLHKIFNCTNFEKKIQNNIILHHMSADCKKLYKSFSEEEINRISDSVDSNKLVKEFENRFNKFRTNMLQDNSRNINKQYKAFLTFTQLIKYDYYYFLKKFDARLPELDFIYRVNFKPILGAMAIEELKDLHSVIDNIEPRTDWENIFKLINEYSESPIIPENSYKKVIKPLEDLKQSNALKHIIALIDSDPIYTNTVYIQTPNIVNKFLENSGATLQEHLKKTLNKKKDSQVNILAKKIFGKIPIIRLRNYSNKLNVHIVDKGCQGFKYHMTLNYIKSFMSDIYNKDLEKIINLYLVQGKWYSGSVNPVMSDAFYQIQNLEGAIDELDNSLAEDDKIGSALRSYIRADSARNNSILMIDRITKTANEDAAIILKESINSFIKMDQILKKILEDYQLDGNEYITNWTELKNNYNEDIIQDTKNAYNKIYNMLQLLQIYK